METIRVQVPSSLAQRLQLYQDQLPDILEWGLRHVEREIETRTEAESVQEAMALQRKIVATLHLTGAVGPDPEQMMRYVTGHEFQSWTPIKAAGRPASEMIIEERDSR